MTPLCHSGRGGDGPAARGSHLGRGHAVEVLPQHPPHVLPGVGRHLVLEEEGELAALPDAVEVAVDLVVLAACGHSPLGVSLPKPAGAQGTVLGMGKCGRLGGWQQLGKGRFPWDGTYEEDLCPTSPAGSPRTPGSPLA